MTTPRNGRVQLRVLPDAPTKHGAFGVLTALPWCCVVPAAFASAGVVSTVVARWLVAGAPFLLLLTVASLSRAHYLIWAKHHGSSLARVLTVIATAVAITLWAIRLSPTVAAAVLG